MSVNGNEEQQALLNIVPDGGIEMQEIVIPFKSIIPPADAPFPDPGFVAKVERWAFVEKIKVVQEKSRSKTPKYRLVAGRRRWRAIDILMNRDEEQAKRFEDIKVDEYTNLPDHASGAAIMLIENHQRSPNPLADAEAVRELRVDKKVPAQIVTYMTGVTEPQQENALRMLEMLPELRALVLSDKLRIKLAEKIAKLPTKDQKKVLKVYQDRLEKAEKAGEKTSQRLIKADYSKSREAERSKAIGSAPSRLFETGKEERAPRSFEEAAPKEWQEKVLDLIEKINVLLPPETTSDGEALHNCFNVGKSLVEGTMDRATVG